MRFHWFAQQYYTGLPEDYSKSIHSSWVTAPTAVTDSTQVGEDYHMYLRLMQHADRLGWDSLLLNEHHQTSLAMTPSPNLIAAILAVTTENAAIALCGNSLALYNPPLRVAEEIAMLDCLVGRSDHCRDRVRHTHGHWVRVRRTPDRAPRPLSRGA